ncbi:DMT family transporter [Candidatus Formimonas warabiya]|uniref:EamA domain-containing protein n=1 Tax=Formimonas warabiya TaxID=1761012 RepID=A0A3G1L253_FORW1|nr:DMT family transporter [Candidatus Formimonas warabiya]ATW28737.1 hypothetical protein DCMF_18790 [Candidatus Formimonas warabiya]
MNHYYQGIVMVLISALGFSLMPTFAKFAYANGVTISTLLFIRFFLAGLLLFIWAAFKSGKIRFTPKDLCGLFFLGAVCYTLQSGFYFSAVKYIPASLTVVIVYTHPAIIAAASSLIDHEPLTKKIIASVTVSFIGLILMLGTTTENINGAGILFALGASVVYAAYVILSNKILKRVPPLVASAYIALSASAGWLIWGLSTKGIQFRFQSEAWPWILGLVILSTVFAMLTFFRGLELLGPTKATILSTAEPLFGVIIAILLFHDHLTLLQLGGAAGVISGAVMVVYAREEVKSPQEDAASCQQHT